MKKKTLSKVVAGALVGIMSMSMLAGCGDSKSSSTAASAGSSSAASGSTAASSSSSAASSSAAQQDRKFRRCYNCDASKI